MLESRKALIFKGGLICPPKEHGQRLETSMQSWTDQRVERLKTLWAEGLSAAEIAARLGDVSRNAVSAKITRLKLNAKSAPQQVGKTAGRHRGRIFADGTPAPDFETDQDEPISDRRAPGVGNSAAVAGVLALAHRVFANPAKAQAWLFAENPGLDGARPFDLLTSAEGSQRVEDALHQIDHGIYV